jgi:hypothetical protein
MRFLHGAKPSPATVIACLALLISLTGTSIAAVSQLAPNSVGTPQLKNNAVTSKKVKDKTLTRADFKNGTLLRGPRGLRGPAGPTGATGAPGAPGAAGAPGAPGRSALTPLASGETIRGTIGVRENGLAAGNELAATASFPIPATVALDDAHVTVDGEDEASGECTGTATNPTAAPGYVCMYPWFRTNLQDGDTGFIWGTDAAAGEKWGFQVSVNALAAGPAVFFANWAYTAP